MSEGDAKVKVRKSVIDLNCIMAKYDSIQNNPKNITDSEELHKQLSYLSTNDLM